jgi:hypothetical protein
MRNENHIKYNDISYMSSSFIHSNQDSEISENSVFTVFSSNKEPPPHQPIIKIDLPPKNISDIVVKTPEYIKYAFYGNQKEPNLTINKTQYITNNLYIWKGKIHNISDIQYDGELIIETSNGYQKTFLCFLLKRSYTVTEPSSIDRLWSGTSYPVLFDLEKDLSTINHDSQNAIYYKNAINTVIVILTPIYISTNLKTQSPYPKCFILNNITNDYSIVKYNIETKQQKKQKEEKQQQTIQDSNASFIEGLTIDPSVIATSLTEKGLYLDCAPTSQSTKTLPAITIPLDVNGNVNLSNSLLYSSIMNSLILFMIIIFVALSLPYIYKVTVIDVINRINVPDKATRATTVAFFIVMIVFIMTVALIVDGINHSNIYEAYGGVLIGIMLFSGMFRLYLLRNNKDYSFQQVYNWSFSDFPVWLNEIYNYILDHSNAIGTVYIVFCIIAIIPFLIPALVIPDVFIPSGDKFMHVLGVIMGFGFSYNIILAPFAYIIYDVFSIKPQ